MNIQLSIHSEPVERSKSDDALVVEIGVSVRAVMAMLQLHDTGSVLVRDGDKLAGIFTERDALRMMAARADMDVPIETVMVKDPVTIARDAPIADAIKSMSTGGYRRLPIVDADGALVGVVKTSGILAYFVDHFPEAVFNLPPEPHAVVPEREGA